MKNTDTNVVHVQNGPADQNGEGPARFFHWLLCYVFDGKQDIEH